MGDDMSLASGDETTAFSSFTMSQETTVPPCHQTMENSDMEISLDADEEDETKTIIASETSSRNLRFYQMKLSTYKSNATRKLLKVIKIMFSKEPQMEIELHDSMNEDFESNYRKQMRKRRHIFHQFTITRTKTGLRLCFN